MLACTETSSAEAGSSQIDQVRVAGEGAGDGDALLLAAGELGGPLEQEARLDAHVGGELVDLGAHRALLGAAELAHGAREDGARAPGRVERGVRVLEDHLDGAQRVLRALARRWTCSTPPSKVTRAGVGGDAGR